MSKIRLKVKNSWYIDSQDYELFGSTGYNYGYAYSNEIEMIGTFDNGEGAPVEWSAPLSKGIEMGVIKCEYCSLPEDIIDEQEDYEERIYESEGEIESLKDVIFFYVERAGENFILYDIIEYKGKPMRLYLYEDED